MARKIAWDHGLANRGTREAPAWYCRFVDSDGRRKTVHTHQPSKDLARRFLLEIKGRVARGLVGIPEVTQAERQQRALTVGELADRFAAEYARPKIKSLIDYRRHARTVVKQRIKPFPIAHLAVVEVRPLDVRIWRDALAAAGYSGHSVNDALKFMSTAIGWARESDMIAYIRNPVEGIERLPAAPMEDHYSLAEVPAHLHYQPAISLKLSARDQAGIKLPVHMRKRRCAAAAPVPARAPRDFPHFLDTTHPVAECRFLNNRNPFVLTFSLGRLVLPQGGSVPPALRACLDRGRPFCFHAHGGTMKRRRPEPSAPICIRLTPRLRKALDDRAVALDKASLRRVTRSSLAREILIAELEKPAA